MAILEDVTATRVARNMMKMMKIYKEFFVEHKDVQFY